MNEGNKNNYKHGQCYSREYRSWDHMKSRCYNKNVPAYKNYGGRGITVCKRWKDNFINFYADMGPSNGLTLERVDNNGVYEPKNCIWTSRKNQQRNTRKTLFIKYKDGRLLSMAEAAEVSGINYQSLIYRYRNGWRGEKLFSPVNNF